MRTLSGRGHLNSLIALLFVLHTPAFGGSVEFAKARVQASYAALESAERDYSRRQSGAYLSAGERSDYRVYIAQLRQRFFEACAELEEVSDGRAETSAPCPSRPPRTTSAAAVDQANELTSGERTTALAQDLDSALGDFDEMLLREQERVKAATPPSNASGGGQGGGAQGGAGQDGAIASGGASGETAADGGQASGGPATSGAQGEAAGTETGTVAAAAGTGSGEAPAARSGSHGGRQRPAGRGVPPDIPDGRDDDVVARQLREAAEKETDPELRARLWEEYRRYKRGTR